MTKADEIRDLVWNNLKDTQLIYLATVEGDQPRVRPVTLLRKDTDLYTVSVLKHSKISQIKKNSKAEFSFCIPGIGFNAVRVECKTEIVQDPEVKKAIYDSPDHALVKLIPTKFTLFLPPEFENQAVFPK